MSELKPCPFCGGVDIVNDDGVGAFGESVVRYAAKCSTCGVSFWHPEIGPANQPAETWFDWNTRPIEDALQTKLEEAERRLEAVREVYETGWLHIGTNSGEDGEWECMGENCPGCRIGSILSGPAPSLRDEILDHVPECLEDPDPSPWISVEERLPEEHGYDLLVLHEDGYCDVALFTYDEFGNPCWLVREGVFRPAYWMPLPAPPQPKSKEGE